MFQLLGLSCFPAQSRPRYVEELLLHRRARAEPAFTSANWVFEEPAVARQATEAALPRFLPSPHRLRPVAPDDATPSIVSPTSAAAPLVIGVPVLSPVSRNQALCLSPPHLRRDERRLTFDFPHSANQAPSTSANYTPAGPGQADRTAPKGAPAARATGTGPSPRHSRNGPSLSPKSRTASPRTAPSPRRRTSPGDGTLHPTSHSPRTGRSSPRNGPSPRNASSGVGGEGPQPPTVGHGHMLSPPALSAHGAAISGHARGYNGRRAAMAPNSFLTAGLFSASAGTPTPRSSGPSVGLFSPSAAPPTPRSLGPSVSLFSPSAAPPTHRSVGGPPEGPPPGPFSASEAPPAPLPLGPVAGLFSASAAPPTPHSLLGPPPSTETSPRPIPEAGGPRPPSADTLHSDASSRLPTSAETIPSGRSGAEMSARRPASADTRWQPPSSEGEDSPPPTCRTPPHGAEGPEILTVRPHAVRRAFV
jgi:hypothetical protein